LKFSLFRIELIDSGSQTLLASVMQGFDQYLVGFEVLTAAIMKVAVFWVVAPW
jgi:hypothetical protein